MSGKESSASSLFLPQICQKLEMSGKETSASSLFLPFIWQEFDMSGKETFASNLFLPYICQKFDLSGKHHDFLAPCIPLRFENVKRNGKLADATI